MSSTPSRALASEPSSVAALRRLGRSPPTSPLLPWTAVRLVLKLPGSLAPFCSNPVGVNWQREWQLRFDATADQAGRCHGEAPEERGATPAPDADVPPVASGCPVPDRTDRLATSSPEPSGEMPRSRAACARVSERGALPLAEPDKHLSSAAFVEPPIASSLCRTACRTGSFERSSGTPSISWSPSSSLQSQSSSSSSLAPFSSCAHD